MSELEDFEATGKIQRAKSVPKKAAVEKAVEPESKVFGVEHAHSFEMAVAREKMTRTGQSIFITSEFMNYLLRGSDETDVMYQGVRIYLDGTKEELDKQEAMSAEKRADYLAFKGKSLDEVQALKKEAQEAR